MRFMKLMGQNIQLYIVIIDKKGIMRQGGMEIGEE